MQLANGYNRMIITTIDQLSNYIPQIPLLDLVCSELKQSKLLSLDEGRYELFGDSVFYMVNLYTSSENNDMMYEFHKKYIDVQIMLSGSEICLWSNTDADLNTIDPSIKDISFNYIEKESAKLHLDTGNVAIFFPGELHKPGLDSGYRKENRKIVFKIKY